MDRGIELFKRIDGGDTGKRVGGCFAEIAKELEWGIFCEDRLNRRCCHSDNCDNERLRQVSVLCEVVMMAIKR